MWPKIGPLAAHFQESLDNAAFHGPASSSRVRIPLVRHRPVRTFVATSRQRYAEAVVAAAIQKASDAMAAGAPPFAPAMTKIFTQDIADGKGYGKLETFFRKNGLES